MQRILIVEDDTDLGGLLRRYLQMRGFDVSLAENEIIARDLMQQQNFDIAVLDVMLPGKDGFTVATALASIAPNLPFLFLTARRQQADILRGLGLGADDYVLKPFDADELVLRITNILKRTHPVMPRPQTYFIGHYIFEPGELKLTFEGADMLLTEKEAALLELLCTQPGKLIKRKAILENLWGSADFFNGRSLDVFISRLRKRLDRDPDVHIEVVRGAGFILIGSTNKL